MSTPDAEALARYRAALVHALTVATENHRAGGPGRDWEAGRIDAYRHALDLLDETGAP
jgi:hypothetical protein